MKMNDYINDFTNHLTEAMEIGDTSNLKTSDKKFNNILGFAQSAIIPEIIFHGNYFNLVFLEDFFLLIIY